MCAEWSRAADKRLITTECWSLVDYKDWPLLEWDWLKELCELGVPSAAATRCWVAMVTNNFNGPQFAGMWRDIDWHRRMTSIIHSAFREDGFWPSSARIAQRTTAWINSRELPARQDLAMAERPTSLCSARDDLAPLELTKGSLSLLEKKDF